MEGFSKKIYEQAINLPIDSPRVNSRTGRPFGPDSFYSILYEKNGILDQGYRAGLKKSWSVPYLCAPGPEALTVHPP